MEVIDKDVLHLEEFFREFLCKRITTKNDFNRFAGRLHFHRQFLQSTHHLSQSRVYNLTLVSSSFSSYHSIQPGALGHGTPPVDLRRQQNNQIGLGDQPVA